MPDKKSLPAEIFDHWPEIFEEIQINTVPIDYLKCVIIHFKDGKIWEIDIGKNKSRSFDSEMIEESIETILEEYDDYIESVDFRLDTEKVKKDIKKRTEIFLKKRK